MHSIMRPFSNFLDCLSTVLKYGIDGFTACLAKAYAT